MSKDEDSKRASKLREQANLVRGVILGAILGIVGNLFVAHFYETQAAFIEGYFGVEWLNLANLVLSFVFLILIVITIWVSYVIVRGLEATSSALEAFVREKSDEKQE